MKKEIKLYLEEEDIASLKRKAQQSGFVGRGAIISYIRKVSAEEVIFLDSNFKKVAKEFILK